ncbi:MAG TPA: YiiX family permuted papain-like enzyme [Sphingobacterium sp.]|jgi:hypothetical protein|nr:YiiX family permuted papain-like enzyme [Sphingobacterium sp.]
MKRNVVQLFILLGLLLIGAGMYRHCYPSQRIEQVPVAGSNSQTQQAQKSPQAGDLIFQTSLSQQSQAIQLATGSRYSHCGIIFKEKDQLYVLEAVQPVKRTPLTEWIKRGKNEHYVIKRLKDAEKILTDSVINEMQKMGEAWEGKDYDLAFEWTDDKMYCSELIWKIYARTTGIKIGKLEQLKDFDLSNEIVKNKLAERYGNRIPLDDTVISPAAIYASKLLETVQ